LIVNPVYIGLCVLVGLAGIRRRAGFFGFTLVAVALTPLGALFILFVAAEKRRKAPRDAS